MLEVDLTSRLLADTTVSSLISTRLYAVVLPESIEGTCISYRTISDVPNYTLQGQRIGSKTRVEYNAWSLRYLDAKSLSAAIQSSLEGFSGLLGSTDVQFIEAGGVNTDGYDQDSRLYRVQQDFLIYRA
jgi:hypothetical protein